MSDLACRRVRRPRSEVVHDGNVTDENVRSSGRCKQPSYVSEREKNVSGCAKRGGRADQPHRSTFDQSLPEKAPPPCAPQPP